MLRGKFKAVYIYIKKEEKSQMSNFIPLGIRKERQAKPKATRVKGILKM